MLVRQARKNISTLKTSYALTRPEFWEDSHQNDMFLPRAQFCIHPTLAALTTALREPGEHTLS
jgi:hypothetical protein